jgi:hypothetical protein
MKKGLGYVSQVVECLASKQKVLSSNPNAIRKGGKSLNYNISFDYNKFYEHLKAVVKSFQEKKKKAVNLTTSTSCYCLKTHYLNCNLSIFLLFRHYKHAITPCCEDSCGTSEVKEFSSD